MFDTCINKVYLLTYLLTDQWPPIDHLNQKSSSECRKICGGVKMRSKSKSQDHSQVTLSNCFIFLRMHQWFPNKCTVNAVTVYRRHSYERKSILCACTILFTVYTLRERTRKENSNRGHIHCVRKKVTPSVLIYSSGKWCRILAKFCINNATSNCKQTTKYQ